MKKLFIITDVVTIDARRDVRKNVIGSVIRAELPPEGMTANYDQLRVFPDGSAFVFADSDCSIWYDIAPDFETFGMHFHAYIKVKPLQ